MEVKGELTWRLNYLEGGPVSASYRVKGFTQVWTLTDLEEGCATLEMELPDVRTFADSLGLTGHLTLHLTSEVAKALRAGKIKLQIIMDGLPD